MARRNLEYYREFTASPQPDMSGEQMMAVGSDFATGVIKQSQEAKIAENASSAQLDLTRAMAELQVKHEGDPMKGAEEFKAARNSIFEKYGEDVSPFFKQEWNKATQSMAQRTDLIAQKWALKQSRVNAVASVNTTMQNYLNQALTDGQQYAMGDDGEIDGLINYAAAHEQLQEYGTKNLGETSTAEVLDTFGQDYMKMFLTGIADTSPAKALAVLEREEVRSAFSNQQDYVKLKDALQVKTKNVEKVGASRQGLNSMRQENEMLAAGGQMNYAQIQQAKVSDAARGYFEKLNGFSNGSGSRGGYTAADKTEYKTAIYESVQSLLTSDDIDDQSIRVVQDHIYNGMAKGAITQTQGLGYIDQLVAPLIEQKEASLSEYQTGKWTPWEDNLGFDGIKEFYDNSVKVSTEKADKSTAKAVEAQNKTNQANLYDYYYGALQARAEAAGIPVGSINQLPKDKRQKIYSEAQSVAQETFLKAQIPALRTLPDVPNFIYQDGKLIQGMAGTRNVKPTGTATANFKLMKDTDTRDIYRVYPDGTKEKVGKVE